jgi:hypothetical protein
MLGWPSYQLLTGSPDGDNTVGEIVAAAITPISESAPLIGPMPATEPAPLPELAEISEPIPLPFRVVGDQTLRVETAVTEPVEHVEAVADIGVPIPRPVSERPVAPAAMEQDATTLGYASSRPDDSDTEVFDSYVTGSTRPLSANPYYQGPGGSNVSSGDYLLEDRYGGGTGGQGLFLDEYESQGGRPGHYLSEYQRGLVRPGGSSVTLNLGN